MRQLQEQVKMDISSLGFKLIDQRLLADDERDDYNPPLQAKVLARDRRRHNPGYDALYLIDVRKAYAWHEIENVATIQGRWKLLHTNELGGHVNFVIQPLKGSGIECFYVVRHLITVNDMKEAERFGLRLYQ